MYKVIFNKLFQILELSFFIQLVLWLPWNQMELLRHTIWNSDLSHILLNFSS